MRICLQPQEESAVVFVQLLTVLIIQRTIPPLSKFCILMYWMKITVYFIRHGESWANKIQKLIGPIHWCIADPSLTKQGILASTTMKAPDVDIVCCSELLRAKQTAKCAYPNQLIYVVPGTKELGFGLDNIPLKRSKYASDFIYIKHDVKCEDFMDYIKKFCKNLKKDVSISLFTHHRFIAKHTNVLNSRNNEIIKKVYSI